MRKRHILIILKKGKICQMLTDCLEKQEFFISHLELAVQVIPFIKKESPNLIIMDILLTDMSSLDLYLKIRRFSKIPILLITPQDEEMDLFTLLELGQGESIHRHLAPQEIAAYAVTVLRRHRLPPARNDRDKWNLELNEITRQILINGNELKLTSREFDLLKVMLMEPKHTFSRDELMNLIKGYSLKNERTLDTHIKNLRKKIAVFFPDEEIICSVYGVGYRLNYNKVSTRCLHKVKF